MTIDVNRQTILSIYVSRLAAQILSVTEHTADSKVNSGLPLTRLHSCRSSSTRIVIFRTVSFRSLELSFEARDTLLMLMVNAK